MLTIHWAKTLSINRKIFLSWFPFCPSNVAHSPNGTDVAVLVARKGWEFWFLVDSSTNTSHSFELIQEMSFLIIYIDGWGNIGTVSWETDLCHLPSSFSAMLTMMILHFSLKLFLVLGFWAVSLFFWILFVIGKIMSLISSPRHLISCFWLHQN